MTADTSARFEWLTAVAEHQQRQARTRALRRELQAAREAGKRIRHERRLARLAREIHHHERTVMTTDTTNYGTVIFCGSRWHDHTPIVVGVDPDDAKMHARAEGWHIPTRWRAGARCPSCRPEPAEERPR